MKIDKSWIGFQGPQDRISCTHNEITAAASMNAARCSRAPVLRGPLTRQLHGAEDKGPKRSKGVHPNGQRRVRQGCKVHCRRYVNSINIAPL